MNKKLKVSKSKACVVKRSKSKLTLKIAYFFETCWAVGVSVVAAMAFSNPTRVSHGQI